MTEHTDPPVSNPNTSDDDWDDVVFDDTEVPLSGGKKPPKGGKLVKGLALATLVAAGGAGVYFWLLMQPPAATPVTPASLAMQQNTNAVPAEDLLVPNDTVATPADGMPMDPMGAPHEVVEDIDLDTLVASNDQMDMPEWDESDMDGMGMVEPMDGAMPPPEEMMAEDAENMETDIVVDTTADPGATVDIDMPMPGDSEVVVAEDDTTTTVAIDTDDVNPDTDAVIVADEQVDVTIEPADTSGAPAPSQAEVDQKLEEELIASLTSGTAPTPPVDPTPTEEQLINNLETMNATVTANPAGDPARIEADAYIRPQAEKYYIIKQDSAPVELNRELMSAKRALNEGRNALALDMFNNLYEVNPNDMRVQMGRAVAMQRLGRYTEALSVYEQVLRDNPDNLEALTNMLGILSVQNPAYSVEKLQRLEATYPANAGVKVQLALSYGAMGYVGEAIKLLQAAYNMEPNNPTIAYNLAVMYDRAGDRVNAAMFYRRALVLEREGGYRGTVPIEAIQARLGAMR